jgi:hypothetical protein
MEAQAAPGTTAVIEEISTIKTALSNGHQRSQSTTDRMQSTVESLEEYSKRALDQVNAVC